MITFIAALLVLLVGYLIYGRVVERIVVPSDDPTPAMAHPDGVDFTPMKKWRVFLIQLLNIAGTGPIFGPLMGAVFGPVVFLWIVFGSILGGAVHDYLSGMASVRNDGASISEIVGKYLGAAAKQVMRIFSVVLLVCVGAVFTTSPAGLLARLTPDYMNTTFWIVVIMAYYVLATLLPIDKVIGKLYPVFGVVLMFMAVGIVGGLVFGGYTLPELTSGTFANLHPEGKPIWSYMFVTVACGAVSGFHSTQSPMMARCIESEKQGRAIFYGAMLVEAVIAMVWAAAGLGFYGNTKGLSGALASLGQSGVVYDISVGVLGKIGGALAVIGVVVCPISTGDTAFRSARLTLADWFKLDQSSLGKRLVLAVPLIGTAAVLTQIDFDVIWRYFSWSNQTLAMIVLWAMAVYLVQNAKKVWYSLVSAVPAAFMSAVSATYILMADEGFRLSTKIAYPAGIAAAAFLLVVFLLYMIRSGRAKQRELS